MAACSLAHSVVAYSGLGWRLWGLREREERMGRVFFQADWTGFIALSRRNNWFVSDVAAAAAAAVSVCCHLLLMYVANGSVSRHPGAWMVDSFVRDASDWIMSVIWDVSLALCYSQLPSCWRFMRNSRPDADHHFVHCLHFWCMLCWGQIEIAFQEDNHGPGWLVMAAYCQVYHITWRLTTD